MTNTTAPASIPTTASKIGDRVEFDHLVRYNGYDPNYKAKGLPLTEYRRAVGTVTAVIAWAGGHTDVQVMTDDGDTVITRVADPITDICY